MSILSNFYSSIYFIFYQIAFITLLLSWQQNNLIKRGKGHNQIVSFDFGIKPYLNRFSRVLRRNCSSILLVRLEGIEPPAYSLGNWRSVRLSYRRMYTLLYRF